MTNEFLNPLSLFFKEQMKSFALSFVSNDYKYKWPPPINIHPIKTDSVCTHKISRALMPASRTHLTGTFSRVEILSLSLSFSWSGDRLIEFLLHFSFLMKWLRSRKIDALLEERALSSCVGGEWKERRWAIAELWYLLVKNNDMRKWSWSPYVFFFGAYVLYK